ncbi:MAG: FtsW/RodA/SpoVE family cell cycle protein [Polyangiaceae bacterium]|nr:FtsW/RodA/SpoVE family cell cycle protein [Polyangiaceae bacterium]MCB9606264.1 FtsW/RodA/SpoVE family cell cycle protein [Polyangiaceae bacterium]
MAGELDGRWRWVLGGAAVCAAALLGLTGLLVLRQTHYPYQDLVSRQLSWAAVGLVVVGLSVSIEPKALTRLAYPLAAVAVLGVSLAAGLSSQAWLRPADVLCVAAIPAFARFSAERQNPASSLSAWLAGSILGLVGLKLLLSAGPGGALIWLACGVAALSLVRWSVAQRLSFGAVSLLVLGTLVALLRPYQLARLKYWLFPGDDPHGAGWRFLELRRLLAQGGLWGADAPWPTRHGVTAFEAPYVFVGNQAGWVGMAGVVLLNLVVVGVAAWIGLRASSIESRAIGRGVAAFWGVHLLLAAGGNLGLVPEIANTAPLLGYGGSAVVAALLSLGLLLHVLRRREETPDQRFA